jgi:hypothetical protein
MILNNELAWMSEVSTYNASHFTMQMVMQHFAQGTMEPNLWQFEIQNADPAF